MEKEINKEAWNLFGKPFGKKPAAPATAPTPAAAPGTPLKEPPKGIGVQKKFWERSKSTPNDDHGVVIQTILVNPSFKKSYQELETAAPKAFKVVDKYVTKWNEAADKLQPSGGLTSKEAAEKWAAIWDKKEPNEVLADLLEDFKKKYQTNLLMDNAGRSFNTLLGQLNKFLGRGQKQPLTFEERAIVNFYRKLDKAFPDTAEVNPPRLKNEIKSLKEELAKMIKDPSYLKPTVRKSPVAPEKEVVPGMVPNETPTPESVPKSASDNTVNGTSILYENIEMVGPMMEVDSSTDEIENLSKLFMK